MSEVFTERGKVITFLKRSCCNEGGCLNGKWEMLRMIPRIVLHSYIVVSNLYTCIVVVISKYFLYVSLLKYSISHMFRKHFDSIAAFLNEQSNLLHRIYALFAWLF